MCRAMSGADTSGSIDIAKSREVLPKNVIPKQYNLTLEPNFKDFNFDGTGEPTLLEGKEDH